MKAQPSIWTLENEKMVRQVAFMSKEQAERLQVKLRKSLHLELRVVEYRRIEPGGNVQERPESSITREG